jgi:hypothetical protein
MSTTPVPHTPHGTVRIEKKVNVGKGEPVWVLTRYWLTEVQATQFLKDNPTYRRAQ